MEHQTKGKVLKKAVVWKELYFYRKSDAIYQLTVEFCRRFLPPYGDRAVDQMVQAARRGKQNIIEGSEDGQTSSEMEIKLLNVARGSLQELQADYQDYLNSEVAFQLPEGIAKDEEVSVIIRHDTPSVMDAYDKTDKTMSLQEFATTDEAAAVITRIRARQAAITQEITEIVAGS